MAAKDVMKSDEGYYFVYTLSYNGNIFYIGCCKDIVKRYTQHLNNKKGNLAAYITSIKETGNLPELNVITFRPQIEAHSVEETLIKCVSVGGHKLFNVQHYRYEPKKEYSKSKKQACQLLKQEQNRYKEMVKLYQGYYSPSIRKING